MVEITAWKQQSDVATADWLKRRCVRKRVLWLVKNDRSQCLLAGFCSVLLWRSLDKVVALIVMQIRFMWRNKKTQKTASLELFTGENRYCFWDRQKDPSHARVADYICAGMAAYLYWIMASVLGWDRCSNEFVDDQCYNRPVFRASIGTLLYLCNTNSIHFLHNDTERDNVPMKNMMAQWVTLLAYFETGDQIKWPLKPKVSNPLFAATAVPLQLYYFPREKIFVFNSPWIFAFYLVTASF